MESVGLFKKRKFFLKLKKKNFIFLFELRNHKQKIEKTIVKGFYHKREY